jgi:predicted dehydrogenase
MNVTYNHEYPHRLKTCFIGCGSHAIRNVYPAFQFAPVHLAAVCDLDSDRAEHVRRQFGAEHTYTDYREMIQREKPDVVFAVTNYDEQGQPRYPKFAMDCMNAGAHVWIEKPPAASSRQVEDMMAVSRSTGLHVGVGFKKMFFPANVKAREIINRTEFGRITSITATYPQTLPPQSDRSDPRKMVSFLNHVVHPHSVLRYLGGEIDWIFVNRNEAIGSAVVSIRFKSGAIGNLHFAHGRSRMAPFERTEVIGEGANVVVDNNIRVTYYRKASVPPYGRGDSIFGDDADAPLHWEPEFSLGQLYNKGLFLLGYAPEVIHFTTRLLENQPPVWGTLDDAWELLRIYEAYLKPDGEVAQIQPKGRSIAGV